MGYQRNSIVVSRSGVQCILQSGGRLSYVVYNLSSGKLETTCHFSTDVTSFIGKSEQNIALINADEVRMRCNSLLKLEYFYHRACLFDV